MEEDSIKKNANDFANNLDIIKEIFNADRIHENIGLKKCIQCGLCSAGCPAARVSDFSPRLIINAVLHGYNQILQDEIIWNCFSCYTCHMRCPRGNSPITVIQVLKQLAIEKGFGTEHLKDFLSYGDSFIQIGTGSYSKEMVVKLFEDWGEKWLKIRLENEKTREDLGLLPSLLPIAARKEIRKILELTGFIKRLDRLRNSTI
ncbi:MAG: 4Fe-4S dicluster domain-containing protein [Candidatus Helarchaeota archaeon]